MSYREIGASQEYATSDTNLTDRQLGRAGNNRRRPAETARDRPRPAPGERGVGWPVSRYGSYVNWHQECYARGTISFHPAAIAVATGEPAR